jgi:hypothetical protein
MIMRRPFHEAIICVIQSSRGSELVPIARILEGTVIPKGHDEIVAAWRSKAKEQGFTEDSIEGVAQSLLLHKKEQVEKNELETVVHRNHIFVKAPYEPPSINWAAGLGDDIDGED